MVYSETRLVLSLHVNINEDFIKIIRWITYLIMYVNIYNILYYNIKLLFCSNLNHYMNISDQIIVKKT